MRWKPWSSSIRERRFEVKVVVRRIDGLPASPEAKRAAVEVRWRGNKAALSLLRRGRERRNLTREKAVSVAGVVEWDEEFSGECGIDVKSGKVQSWEILFALLFVGSSEGLKNEKYKVGISSLDLADYVCLAEDKEVEIIIPSQLTASTSESKVMLYLTLRLSESRTIQDSPYKVQRTVSPVPPSPPSDGAAAYSSEKDEPFARGGKRRKLNLLKRLLSNEKSRKTCLDVENSEAHCSKSDEAKVTYPGHIGSTDTDCDEDEEGNDISNISVSLSYGSLASANSITGSSCTDGFRKQENCELVDYSHQRSYVSFSQGKDIKLTMSEQPISQILKKRIFSWKKRSLNFTKMKGEPLLNKSYAEEGGDDIDFDRRQLNTSAELLFMLRLKGFPDLGATGYLVDDHFSVGSWELKELINRDGNMKLHTEFFFASIDQRSECASGESACAVLVAIIADWFQTNQGMMPTKSEFDTLIREGSLEWRKLCENGALKERFPDKHFDLETVVEAKIRPISFDSGRSFIGFFLPGSDNDGFDYLHGAMSFDNIWEEISKIRLETTENIPQLYIISWNDHFFILVVDCDAYYIIDTLGERLYEGCNQAYILKFNESTSIRKVPSEGELDSSKVQDFGKQQVQPNNCNMEEKSLQDRKLKTHCTEEELLCKGKDSCKEFIKNFLAAIPIRELHDDLKRGLQTSTSVHHRLQIEFHATQLCNVIEEETTSNFSRTVESDSELSLSMESDPELSGSPNSITFLPWPMQPAVEFAWAMEPVKEAATTFLYAHTPSLEVVN